MKWGGGGGEGRRGEGAVCAREGEREVRRTGGLCGDMGSASPACPRRALDASSSRDRGCDPRLSFRSDSQSSRARVFERRPVAREQNPRVLIGPPLA